MVRNDPTNPYQRANVVQRLDSRFDMRVKMEDCIHGRMSPDGDWASLIILDFIFQSQKRKIRIKSARIELSFEEESGQRDRDPEVFSIAPDGAHKFQPTRQVEIRGGRLGLDAGPSISASISAGWENTISREVEGATVITGSTMIQGRNHGAANAVVWTLLENQLQQTGIPYRTRAAILLKRKSMEKFLARIQVVTDVSGLSFSNLMESPPKDDPILFNPYAPITRNTVANFEINFLEKLDLSKLMDVTMSNTFENIQQIEINERERRHEVEALLGHAASEQPPKSSTASKSKSSSDSTYFELWNTELTSEKKWIPKASIHTDLNKKQFPGFASKPLPQFLDKKELKEYFSWIGDVPEVPPVDGEVQEEKKTRLCNLIVRKSNKKSEKTRLMGFDDLEDLLSQPPVEAVIDCFKLPEDYALVRKHDRGTCQLYSSGVADYVVQTPFYSSGFWSLAFHCAIDSDPNSSSSTSGVIQMDNDASLSDVFNGVSTLAKRHGHHPSLLPVQLFITHCNLTTKTFESIFKDIATVDVDLLTELKRKSKSKEAAKLHRRLSMTLHQSSMKLAELGRRRKFEEDLGDRLKQDLQNERDLEALIGTLETFANMSKSKDLDIKTMPEKIEAQRNVLYSLIAQHDSYLQSKLSHESLRDSKAMKTLSILTILFLPGAFIATIFSTNMFEFESKRQQIRIYFAIVVPLTFALMVGWIIWLVNTDVKIDDEESSPKEKSN